jgi:hypothetical protein
MNIYIKTFQIVFLFLILRLKLGAAGVAVSVMAAGLAPGVSAPIASPYQSTLREDLRKGAVKFLGLPENRRKISKILLFLTNLFSLRPSFYFILNTSPFY